MTTPPAPEPAEDARTGTAAVMHVVATAGHVDHGKSALVRALTGTDPDRFVEEQRRGLTIDLGFAWMTLPGAGPVVFVDVPGHIRFISNMLAGVAVVEAGMLCVDAREGWRAQTEEHLRILDLIGLSSGLVVVTKAGLVDEDRLAGVRDDVARRTAGTVLADAPVVSCDSIDGTGLDQVRQVLGEVVTAGRVGTAQHDRPRLWVDRSFTIGGAGTVVTGGVGHGTFVVGGSVVAAGPAGTALARVRGIQALGRRTSRAPAGTRAALNLAGIDRRAIRRGDAIVRAGQWHYTAVVDATLQVLASIDHEVTQRGAYLAYLGTGEHAVRLRPLAASSLAPGETGTVRLRLSHALPLVPGDRYVLRETGRGELVGGGELVDIAPRRSGGLQGRATDTAQAMAQPTVAEGEWVRADELERRLGVDVEPVVGTWVVAPATLEAARDTLLDRIERSRPVGLDAGQLDQREQAVLALLKRDQAADIDSGYAVAPEWRDELGRHPLVRQLETSMFSPPAPATASLPPAVLRALVRRGYVLVKDGTYFAAGAVPAASAILADLSRARPDGITVSEARQALSTTRKWAVPLLQLLDDAGITTRRGDRRSVRPPPPPG
ncbi:MAG: SelB C-terminal domain-containing protein [Acidimicrobiales bacterium]